jgi:hypothetical protein
VSGSPTCTITVPASIGSDLLRSRRSMPRNPLRAEHQRRCTLLVYGTA